MMTMKKILYSKRVLSSFQEGDPMRRKERWKG
jgi:hypothetical protein